MTQTAYKSHVAYDMIWHVAQLNEGEGGGVNYTFQ